MSGGLLLYWFVYVHGSPPQALVNLRAKHKDMRVKYFHLHGACIDLSNAYNAEMDEGANSEKPTKLSKPVEEALSAVLKQVEELQAYLPKVGPDGELIIEEEEEEKVEDRASTGSTGIFGLLGGDGREAVAEDAGDGTGDGRQTANLDSQESMLSMGSAEMPSSLMEAINGMGGMGSAAADDKLFLDEFEKQKKTEQ
ncbi:unnamed protein product [Amoebophrya sp. A25]|nr:unnamed protein product [Amoebophrya sp. A25]|eukprot:GSA25T00012058001.1